MKNRTIKKREDRLRHGTVVRVEPLTEKVSDAAALLSARGVQARQKMLTPKQRSEIARHAVNVRWAKKRGEQPAKPDQWYGLVELPDIVDRFDASGKLKPLGEPELLKWSRDKEELYGQMRAMTAYPLPDRNLQIIELSYDPSRLMIKRDFKPSVDTQNRPVMDT